MRGLPPVLYRPPEDRRHRRPGRAVQAEVHARREGGRKDRREERRPRPDAGYRARKGQLRLPFFVPCTVRKPRGKRTVAGGKIARMPRRLALVLVPAFHLALASCATNPVTGGQDFVLVSEAQELRIGRQVDAQVKQRYALYDAHGMQAYVEGIGQRLAKASHRPGISYRFVLIDTADVNAFALPGGYVYISRGILPYLNSEAELAGVIGHEIGHVTARHSVQRLSAAQGAQIAVTVAQIFIPAIRTQAGGLAVDALGYGAALRLRARPGAAGRPARRDLSRAHRVRPGRDAARAGSAQEPGALRRRDREAGEPRTAPLPRAFRLAPGERSTPAGDRAARGAAAHRERGGRPRRVPQALRRPGVRRQHARRGRARRRLLSPRPRHRDAAAARVAGGKPAGPAHRDRAAGRRPAGAPQLPPRRPVRRRSSCGAPSRRPRRRRSRSTACPRP